MSQAELARRVGVSRQAVSLWLRESEDVVLRSDNLLRIAKALGVPVERLARALPCFEPEEHERLRASLLWDGLFGDLDDLAIALERGDPRAIARVVQVHGLYAAEKVVGPSVWDDLSRYARYLHPARRRQLEALRQWRARHLT